MRLFIAIDLPDLVQDGLSALQTGLDGARWSRREQMHLTLRFLGDTEPSLLPSLQAGLQQVQVPPFALALESLDVFPARRRPRVLVVRTTSPSELAALQLAVESAVRSLGFSAEHRPFAPHVTLARFKQVRRSDVDSYLEKHRAPASPFVVDRFFLYESDLRPEGAVYARRSTFRLGPPE